MYTQNNKCNNTFSQANNDDYSLSHVHHMITPKGMQSSSNGASHQMKINNSPENHYQCQLFMTVNSEATSMNSSSGCSTPTSMASCETTSQPMNNTTLQKSVSSQSLIRTGGVPQNHKQLYHFSALFSELFNSDDIHVRRVYSTGDLQEESSLLSESSMIIEAMSRASPYSPEEKKMRIERYRTKRNQRNFNKKIKYACRKTLADSRPRIRGRFARNDEIVRNPPSLEWCQFGGANNGEEQDEEDENWANIFDSLDPANLSAHHHHQEQQEDTSPFGVFYSNI
ncbi:hypothetical protein PIB30_064364 [Stylosanthes scabra]|uniref:CCT domain-containing protein n=1 Tax=Stylosanthes scabra TaxID=79078 RepID=A0ABU6VKW9_9FABA|nr:hypothetical protein [Stylosanthes scabra]